jgi:predicted secreted Zn-dependent protease
MGNRARLASLSLAAALLWGCAGQVASPRPTPVPRATPSVTASPCAIAVTHLGAFTQRLAADLAALRPVVVSRTFSAGATMGVARQASGSLTAYDGFEKRLGACPATADLSRRVATLRTMVEAALDKLLAGPIGTAKSERSAAVSLLRLLPEVLALSEAAKAVADTLGVQIALATVAAGADEPVGSLPPLPTPTPRPTPRPTPKPPKVATIVPSFFGSGVKVTTYRVTGATPGAISRSMAAAGPHSRWIGGTAVGLTRVATDYRFVFSRDWSGACGIEVTARPAIKLTYTIVLPRWSPRSGATSETVRWWNGELVSIATHERVHVSIYKAAAKRLNSVLASSTCGNATRRLDAVWSDAQRANCEFDMKEYGSAAGLSLKACLAG